MRRPAAPLAVLLVVMATVGAGACGSGEDGGTGDPSVVTGRVVLLDAKRYCVSPDRGVTRRCVGIIDPGDVEGVDVGECVTLRATETPTGPRGVVKVVADDACAAGDVGD